MVTETQVMQILGSIQEPKSGVSITELGMIDEVAIDEGNVMVKLGINFDLYVSPSAIYLINSVKKKLHSLPDVSRVDVQLLSERWEQQMV
ncbi:MAG: iron-sulfur cluster assembly protein [bacterium]